MAKVDEHIITPKECHEAPELTPEQLAVAEFKEGTRRAKPTAWLHPIAQFDVFRTVSLDAPFAGTLDLCLIDGLTNPEGGGWPTR